LSKLAVTKTSYEKNPFYPEIYIHPYE